MNFYRIRPCFFVFPSPVNICYFLFSLRRRPHLPCARNYTRTPRELSSLSLRNSSDALNSSGVVANTTTRSLSTASFPRTLLTPPLLACILAFPPMAKVSVSWVVYSHSTLSLPCLLLIPCPTPFRYWPLSGSGTLLANLLG